MVILVDVDNARYLCAEQLILDPNACLFSTVFIISIIMASDSRDFTVTSDVRFDCMTILGINAANTLSDEGHAQNFAKTLKYALLYYW